MYEAMICKKIGMVPEKQSNFCEHSTVVNAVRLHKAYYINLFSQNIHWHRSQDFRSKLCTSRLPGKHALQLRVTKIIEYF